MIKFLIFRPIAVFMAFTAFFILGIVTYLNIPVSLLPDIAIPEITVQIKGDNTSARELENTVVAPIRQQLLQIGKLRDMRSEASDGSALIRLSFEYGTDTDLAFIEVNEKIDAAMNFIPREIDRPHVIKASATDIPVFNLNLTLKNQSAHSQENQTEFLALCELAETIIKRRIEQLEEVAMVDMTGTTAKEVLIIPDENLLKISGITLGDIQNTLQENNIEPGSMIVKDGHYEYNINFSSVMRTLDDIRNIYIRKNGRLFQLRDIARIEIVPEKEKGMAFYNGKRAVTLSIIKQSDENMSNMQDALNHVIDEQRRMYPDIDFSVSQNQTELLDYTITNLQQNLLLAFIFICLVSAFFMRDIKSPLIIGIGIFVSLIISLLFFYLFHVSLNVISLTGLILALGMMIDNSIIVTDNIGQYRKKGLTLDEACIKGTNEVIAPMLSSALTTISVFVPLVFLSGIAGAIFFDQAFSVAVGLLVSYITGIMLLPVMYKLIYTAKMPGKLARFWNRVKIRRKDKACLVSTAQPSSNDASPFRGQGQIETVEKLSETTEKISTAEKIYHRGVDWIFRHKLLTTILFIAVIPLCAVLFSVIEKEKMPEITQTELMLSIEWNENIHLQENRNRVNQLMQAIHDDITENAALVGEQQYLLDRNRKKTVSESEVYLKVAESDEIPLLKEKIEAYFNQKYPNALITFAPPETVFEKIFNTGEADLTVEFYTKNASTNVTAETVRGIWGKLRQRTNENPTTVSFQKQLNLSIDREKLLLYQVSYDNLYQTIKSGFKENEITTLRSYQQYLPIVIGNEKDEVNSFLQQTFINTSADENGNSSQLPLSTFISTNQGEDIKTIIAGRNGEYLPFTYNETDNAEKIIETIQKSSDEYAGWDIDFSGSFFSNRKMIAELMIILLISILLMYFILAAQFESFVQPFIVLLEIPIDIAGALLILILAGHTLNLMSAIGLVVTCGIIINDSILKVDMMNQLRKSGMKLMEAIHEAGRRRLNAILMTSLTTIVCMAPLLFSHDLGSELEKPLAIATIGGMLIGTPVSLFVVPLAYWLIYRNGKLKIES